MEKEKMCSENKQKKRWKIRNYVHKIILPLTIYVMNVYTNDNN